jgi:ribosomal protein S18 acetylase RimI-like enzyme
MDEFERRAFARSPNAYLCVSSFNPRARAFYDRRGYRMVGTLDRFSLPEHDEHFMRKTMGPTRGYKPA